MHAGLNSHERQDLLQRFNKLDDLDVVLTSYKISGVGQDFHIKCHYIVLFDSANNLPAEDQAIGRIHRINAKYQQMVYRLITRGTFQPVQIEKGLQKWADLGGVERDCVREYRETTWDLLKEDCLCC